MDEQGVGVEQESLQRPDGTWNGIRVHVVDQGGIVVWTGVLQPSTLRDPSSMLVESDFTTRAVVHFVGWASAHAYYRGTPFAPLLELIHGRLAHFSTFESAASDQRRGSAR